MRSLTPHFFKNHTMKIYRFIGNFNLELGQAKILDAEIIHKAKNVLRLNIGEKIILGDGKNNEATAEIIGFGKNFIEADVLEIKENKNESPVCGILYCSILKRENFEWVVQKATECGIKEIVPVISSRTVKFGIKEDRFRKIILEAGEQSGRGELPALGAPLNFIEALKNAEQNDLNLFFEMGYPALSPEDMNGLEAKRIGIFIGPEGGWGEEELMTIKIKAKEDKKFKLVGLGKLTLRAETAAVVASWLMAQG